MANCSGDIVISLDDDGWLSEDTVAGCVQRFTDDKSLGVVGFNIIPPEGFKAYGHDRERMVFSGGAMAVKNDVLKKIGYYPMEFFRQAEETDLALRVIEGGYKIIWSPSLTVYHEKCPVNRNASKFMFYGCRNDLSIVVRRYPLGLLPFAFLYKVFVWNIAGLKKRSLWYTIGGTLAGIWHIPEWLTLRAPVSVKTIKKFLSYRNQKNKQGL
jgi:GT2 family glycosyltransferase